MIQALKKSRMWLFLVAILFTLPVLSSCTSPLPSLNKNTPTVITIWHHYISEQKVVFDQYIEEFNRTVGKEKGILVTAYSMDNSGDIHNKIMQAANVEPGAPEMPDMATVYPGTAYTLFSMDKLVSLEKYMDKSKLNNYADSFLEEGRLTDESGVVIFPVAKSSELLFINYTVYNQFLQDYNAKNPTSRLSEDMLSTFEGILKTAQAYYNWTDAKTPEVANDGMALFGFDAASNFAVIGCRQLGSSFFNVKEKSGTIDLGSPSFKKLWDSYRTPTVSGYFGAYSFYRSEDVQTGDLVMYIGSTAGAKFFPRTVTYKDNTKLDIELKVLPYPVFEGGKRAAVQQGAGVAVIKSTPRKEFASTVFLEWFTEPQRNTEFVLKTGYLPVTKEALTHILPKELNKLKNDPEYENVLKVISQTLDMLESYELYTYKPFEHSDDMRFAFEDKFLSDAMEGRAAFLQALSKGMRSDAALKDITAKERLERFISEVRNEILKID